MSIEIKVTGLKELAERLDATEGLKSGIQAAILYVKGKIAKYPPATAANKPGRFDAKGKPMGWYERGMGWHSPSGRVYARSETLGRRWTTTTKSNGYIGVVGNNATYAKYVQDRDHQAWFHGIRGWKTVQDIAETELETIKKIIKDAIVGFMNRNK